VGQILISGPVYGCGLCRTAREALTSVCRSRGRNSRRVGLGPGPFKPAIDAMPLVDLDAARKQRRTAKRIFDRLVAECEMEGISHATVSGSRGRLR
jgi:hypothetical protein